MPEQDQSLRRLPPAGICVPHAADLRVRCLRWILASALLLCSTAQAADRTVAPPQGAKPVRELDVTMSVVPAGTSVTEAIGRRIEIGGSRAADTPRDGGDKRAKNRDQDHGEHSGQHDAADDLQDQIRGESIEDHRQETEQGESGRKSADGND